MARRPREPGQQRARESSRAKPSHAGRSVSAIMGFSTSAKFHKKTVQSSSNLDVDIFSSSRLGLLDGYFIYDREGVVVMLNRRT